ncbi:hypothetical protein BD769DRAFT_1393979 [Suillus cothurnatus]|nr:hypothetical protein BD769DRAFT_1393979 [Suillus cothurnatus]
MQQDDYTQSDGEIEGDEHSDLALETAKAERKVYEAKKHLANCILAHQSVILDIWRQRVQAANSDLLMVELNVGRLHTEWKKISISMSMTRGHSDGTTTVAGVNTGLAFTPSFLELGPLKLTSSRRGQNICGAIIFDLRKHDKWLWFGLALHTGIEPFTGHIMWMRVWHSNRNPQLILTYYLETIQELDMPMVTQSDPGSENFGIANAHTMLHQWHNPTLQGTLQHRWMHTKKNVMPEITWSQLHHHFTPGFENYLDSGVLPHGVPNLIYNSPDDFRALDFKIILKPGAIDHVRNLYIDPNHAVFELVPQDFSGFMQQCYNELGCPVVDRRTAWDVYLNLYCIVSQLYEQLPPPVVLSDDDLDDDFLPLLENHEDLPFHDRNDGAYYMGGVGGGLGLDESHSRQLDMLAQDDEPNVLSLVEDTNLTESDHAGLVVWEFLMMKMDM